MVALSTDKAANPINLYGATKLCSDKLFIAANNLSGEEKRDFQLCDMVMWPVPVGSVIPHFKKLVAQGTTSLPITHQDMTRFIITLDEGVALVNRTLHEMFGGEIIVPKLPSMKIVDLVSLLGDNLKYHTTGIRPGEKLHEVMIPEEEIRNAVDMGDHYIIQPNHHWWNISDFKKMIETKGSFVTDIKEYASGTNTQWLTKSQMVDLIQKIN